MVKWLICLLNVLITAPASLASHVFLTWDPNPASNIVAYRIYFSTNSIYKTFVQVPASSRQALVPGLNSRTTYYFSATAVDSAGIESSLSAEAAFDLPEREPPQAPDINFSTTEDTPVVVLLNAGNKQAGIISYSISSPPTNGALSGSPPYLIYRPKRDFYGADEFTYIVSDSLNDSAPASVKIYVAPANDPPTLNSFRAIELPVNAGAQSVVLSGITPGRLDGPQKLTVSATSSNPALIPKPAVQYTSPNTTGTLNFTPVANASGRSLITVFVADDGRTNNVTSQSFWVSVVAPPTLDPLADLELSQDSGAHTVALSGIKSGSLNGNPKFIVTVSSSDTRLIPTPKVSYVSPRSGGSLSFTPSPRSFGAAKITVTVAEAQAPGNSITRSFMVIVKPLNKPPTINYLSNLDLDSKLGPKTVLLSGIGAGLGNDGSLLTVTAQSSNPEFLPNPLVIYAGSDAVGKLILSPILNTFGTATITVTVDNHQAKNNVIRRSFLVSVRSAPKIADLTIASDARSLALKWKTDETADCSLEYGTNVTALEIASETSGIDHSAILTNLFPDTAYYLRINASCLTGTNKVDQTASTEPVRNIGWPAEAGETDENMGFVLDYTVQDQYYIAANSTNNASAKYSLNLPKGLNYRLWARVHTPPGGGPLGISIDGADEKPIFAPDGGTPDLWHWALLTDDTAGEQASIFPIDAGTHEIKIQTGPDIWIDSFALANDPAWAPILRSGIPILSLTWESDEFATLSWINPTSTAAATAIEYSPDGVDFYFLGTIGDSFNSITLRYLTNHSNASSLSLIGEGVRSIGLLYPPRIYYFRVFMYDSVDTTGYSNLLPVLF